MRVFAAPNIAPGNSPRNIYFDNVKFILIFLVVAGHYCRNYRESVIMLGINDFIYSFHMPLFIFISGYFSKEIKSQRIKDINNILIPYVFIQLYYIIFQKLIGNNQDWSWTIPIESNWYLLGMLFWRLIIPYFIKLKHPVVFVFVISLLVGFSHEFNEYLNLQRLITFFPFFVWGYFFASTDLIMKYKNTYCLGACCVLLIILSCFIGICYYSHPYGLFLDKMFIPYHGYESFGRYAKFGMIFRVAYFAVAAINSCLFLCIVPERKLFFSGLGKNTLYVFLFHMFFILYLRKYIHYTKYTSELFLLPFAAFITLLFTNAQVAKACDRIIRIDKLLYRRHYEKT
jgi:fucose 4-O-acetylase-like acetyltransferase